MDGTRTGLRRAWPGALLLAAAALAACGSRTDLDVPPPTSTVDASTLDVTVADAPADAPPDVVVVTDAGCSTDAECNDGIACSLDRCDPVLHLCTRAPQDVLCDDGIYCNGAERCDVNAGCVAGSRDCKDAVACTVDGCEESQKSCTHEPDDALCPISHTCDVLLGCQARALAHDSTTLYDIRIPSGQVKVIGATGPQLTDIALHPSNVLYGIGFGSLYVVNQSTGLATLSKSIAAGSLNGADAAPNGTLYVAGGNSLFTLDPSTGATVFVMAFPTGGSSSGDLAFVGSRLLATASGGGTDDLVEFDLALHTAKVLGPVGFTCIWGLAAYGPTLYGLTCEGRILSVDTTSGKGTQLNKVSTAFWGASAR
ncbi:MAG TPA: hypothetical protein VF316_25385 [Polyangiaceae bacterium]